MSYEELEEVFEEMRISEGSGDPFLFELERAK